MKLAAFLRPAMLALLATAPARADFKTGQPADLRLGGPARPQFGSWGVAVDPLTQKVFVSDQPSSRILRYGSMESLQTDAMPEAVLGQPDFLDDTPRTTAAGLAGPTGICVDHTGRLWVADAANFRILRYDNASMLPTGAPASGVLTQPDFNSAIPGTAENRMSMPQGIAVDLTGTLWVSDGNAHRVLRWNNAAARPPGALADGVLGRADFTSSNPVPPSASSLHQPAGIAIEHAGNSVVRLWVADAGNERVMAWNNPATKPNGAAADKVLGRPSFTDDTTISAVRRNNIPHPLSLAVRGADLWVGDAGAARVLLFANAGAKANGADADSLLGQFNFTEALPGPINMTVLQPLALAASGERLWISDYTNYRLVRVEDAATKMGQVPFDGTLGSPPDGKRILNPDSVAIDPVSGKIFVCETERHRILRYASAASLQQGAQPEAVLGQTDFLSDGPDFSASNFYYPSGMTVDVLGNLWVADLGSNRVLRFANAGSLPSGAAAVQVFGQTSFAAHASAAGAAGMNDPASVAIEWGFSPTFTVIIRRLWVADAGNNRVLRFENPLTLANGAAASGVLGQTSMSGTTAALSATGMDRPTGVAIEAARLWVVDRNNRRVLRYENAGTKANGAAADGVLFQSAFNQKAGPADPLALAVALNGRLFVASYQEHRVLWFNNAAAKSNGAAPDGVLGQSTLAASVAGSGVTGLTRPDGVAVDMATGQVWVTEDSFARRFTPALESKIAGYGFNSQNHFFLNILGVGGEKYTIRSSTDLQDWSTIERTDTVPGTGTTLMSWTASAPLNGPKKFYRLQAQ